MGSLTYSGLAADPTRSKVAAKTAAHRALRHPDVRAAVDEAMSVYGAGIPWRVKSLKDAADTVITETSETLNAAGDRSITTKRRSPTPAEIARVIDILNRMDGTYSQQDQAARRDTDRYRSLSARFFGFLQDVSPKYEENVTHDDDAYDSVPYEPRTGRPRRMLGLYPVVPMHYTDKLTYPRAPGARGGPTAYPGTVACDTSASA
jgi:hypothetical protein